MNPEGVPQLALQPLQGCEGTFDPEPRVALRGSAASLTLGCGMEPLCGSEDGLRPERRAGVTLAAWQGADDVVEGRLAAKAGRAPKAAPDADEQGDLPLFAFLSAGTIGGFIAGYAFRSLFPPKGRTAAGEPHAPRA